MNAIAALIYWVIVALWLTVLATIACFYVRNARTFGAARLLLAVLAIDASRNIFENVYFGLYFGSNYGMLPAGIWRVLNQPSWLVGPRVFNVFADCVVLTILLMCWLPLAVKERAAARQHASNLEAMAAIDWLTGVYNRRHFEQLARAELARSQRYARPLSLLMIDIDHFKVVNDRFGHAGGDQVLRALAAVCRAEKRDTDVLARLGGEEFALLLPATPLIAAVQFAERLRQRVRDFSPLVDDEKVLLSVSIGVATASLATPGVESLLRAADEALDEAKRTGRDRVKVSQPRAVPAFAEAAE
jgi:diguanylate cyclase (GGDEF)-like protein